MNIKDLQPRQGKVDITVDVVELSEPKEFDKFGKTGRVANAKVKDETGEITLTLWNEEIDKVKLGSKIKITNGYVSEYKGELQLSAGKFGSIEVMESSTEQPEEELSDQEILSAKAGKASEEDILQDDEELSEDDLDNIDIEEEEVK